MSEHPNRAERRGHGSPEEPIEPAPFIYTRDPWDIRRFTPFRSLRRGRTSDWEAAAPFLLVVGALAFVTLAVVIIHAIGR